MKCKVSGDGLTIDLEKCPHLLIGGSTGSGKSYLMKSILCDILDSNEAKVIVVDPKSVDYMFLNSGMMRKKVEKVERTDNGDNKVERANVEGMTENGGREYREVWVRGPEIKFEGDSKSCNDRRLSWLRNGYTIEDRDSIDNGRVLRMLRALCECMDARYRFMKIYGKIDWKEVMADERLIEEWNGWTEGYGVSDGWDEYGFGDKRIVLMVDELADLIYYDRDKMRGFDKGEIERCLVRLACLGRASGISIILGTQRPDATILSRTVTCKHTIKNSIEGI